MLCKFLFCCRIIEPDPLRNYSHNILFMRAFSFQGFDPNRFIYTYATWLLLIFYATIYPEYNFNTLARSGIFGNGDGLYAFFLTQQKAKSKRPAQIMPQDKLSLRCIAISPVVRIRTRESQEFQFLTPKLAMIISTLNHPILILSGSNFYFIY